MLLLYLTDMFIQSVLHDHYSIQYKPLRVKGFALAGIFWKLNLLDGKQPTSDRAKI